MRNAKTAIATCLLLLSVIFLLGADGGGQGTDERAALLGQQKTLEAKVEKLKREQDFLLFQREMYAQDSKYLIVNVRTRTGLLKYKNRVLKDFRFVPAKRNFAAGIQPGIVVLTNKVEGGKGRNELVFGTAFILRGTQTSASSRAKVSVLTIKKNDLASLYFALEQGAMAYLVR